MRAAIIIASGLLGLGACDAGATKVAQGAAEQVVIPPAVSGVATPPVDTLTAADLRRVCRAGLAAIHGQAIDAAGFEGQTAEAIRIDGFENSIVTASWPAPVDGGRMRAQCRVDVDKIAWKPLDRPELEQNRWMTQAGDPVVGFAMDGARIIITQTLTDGTREQSELIVPIEEKAG